MIIDQLPLLGGDVESNDEIPIERGTTSYKTTQAALVKSAADAAAAAQTSADNAQTSADNVATSLATYVRPNLMDNWYFVGGGSQLGYGVFPINQRGQATYSGLSRYADRWRLNHANMAATINADFVSISNNDASLRTTAQMVSFDYNVIKGKTLTASILLSDGSFYFGSYLIPTNAPTSGTGWYTFLRNSTLVLEIDVLNAKACDFLIGIPSGATLNIIAVKLEIGSTQTLAHQESGAWVLNEVPDFAEELAKCQAYYIKIPYVTAYPCSLGLDGSNPRITIPLPATMAKTPRFTKIGADGFQFGVGASRVSVGGSSDSIQISGNYDALLFTNAVRIDFRTSASIGTAFLPCAVELPAFELSAE